MTTGVILSGQTPAQRREQYAADITYGTNNEFGFDYLRDNMAWQAQDMVQRGHYYVIVDEVDSILIDEARTPLIISGPSSGEANRWFTEFANIATRLVPDVDYEVDEKKRTVGVLEPGIEKVEDYLGIDNLYESANTPLISFLNNSIKARALFKKDKDYVVMNGEVLIVDEHTGRILTGRRYNEGIHQAIEAKEGVAVKAENQTLATITLQNYFRLYQKLSGMTGTAETEAAEFMSTYKLGVVPIPTNKPMLRTDQPDLIYKNEQAKFDQVVEDIVRRHAAGQPVLVGTTSVEKSELLSRLLAKKGIKHEVLNAKNHAREAAIIAQAGRLGAVTVATNMAGRGTDVMLGGNAEFLAVAQMNNRGSEPRRHPGRVRGAVGCRLRGRQARRGDRGGEGHRGRRSLRARHRAPRVAPHRQPAARTLRPPGRPGREPLLPLAAGRPHAAFQLGSRRGAHGPQQRARRPRDRVEGGQPSHPIGTVAGRGPQRGDPQERAQVRRRAQPAARGDLRRPPPHPRGRRPEGARRALPRRRHHRGRRRRTPPRGTREDWDLPALWAELKTLYPIALTIDEVLAEAGTRNKVTTEFLTREVLSDARIAYERREQALGEAAMRELERRVVLSVIDRRWRDHLYEMDYLKDGIGLRAMAQRDPLVEYQREGFALYQTMMAAIREESVGFLFNLEVEVTGGSGVQARGLAQPSATPAQLVYTAPDTDSAGAVEVRNERGQVERAATALAQQQQIRQAAALNPAFAQPAPQQAQPAGRGAFGQRAAAESAPLNRAQRRAQEKKGR